MIKELVSIVIPCRNEEKYIETCVRSVMKFKLPTEVCSELIILDGMSTDRTIEKLEELKSEFPNLIVLPNPGLFQSYAINTALEVANGGWIMRLDAHSRYPVDYLELCLETAKRTNADNVGGLFITMPGGDSYEANLVQALTTHAFGVGDAGFRTGAKEGEADTVPYGFFKRELFERIGKLDERLVRAQDYEFNRRIIATGGKVWRNSAIEVFYFNQPTLSAFYKKQLYKEAPYNAYLWYLAPYAFAPRHAITGVFAVGVLGGLVLSPLTNWIAYPFMIIMALYFLLAILSGIQQAIRYKKPFHAILLPFCFFLYHFIHGIGVLWGLIKLCLGTAPVQKQKEPWKGAGKIRAYPI
jgi:glycosyltransferase involved in cell wall biosynthesis